MICYLIRHGKDDDSVRGGWSKSSLTETGFMQVKELVGRIAEQKHLLNIGRIFSSDLQRAVETSNLIAETLDLKVELRPEFRETNNGIFAGMPNAIANEKYPGIFWNTLEWDEPYPNGESPCGFYERIKEAWQDFTTEISTTTVGSNVILVSHGGVINVILHLIAGTKFSNKEKAERITHATLIPLELNDGIWRRL